MGLFTTDAIKPCRYCNKPISGYAFMCPHCGGFGPGSKGFRQFISLATLMLLIWGILTVFALYYWFEGVGMVGRTLMR